MKNLVGNNWLASSTNEIVEVRNPYNNALIDTVPNSSFDDVNEIVKLSYKAKKAWVGVSIDERCQVMLKFRDLVKKNKFELAKC